MSEKENFRQRDLSRERILNLGNKYRIMLNLSSYITPSNWNQLYPPRLSFFPQYQMGSFKMVIPRSKPVILHHSQAINPFETLNQYVTVFFFCSTQACVHTCARTYAQEQFLLMELWTSMAIGHFVFGSSEYFIQPFIECRLAVRYCSRYWS